MQLQQLGSGLSGRVGKPAERGLFGRSLIEPNGDCRRSNGRVRLLSAIAVTVVLAFHFGHTVPNVRYLFRTRSAEPAEAGQNLSVRCASSVPLASTNA